MVKLPLLLTLLQAFLVNGKPIDDTIPSLIPPSNSEPVDDTKIPTNEPESKPPPFDIPSNFIEIQVKNPQTHGIGNNRYTDYEIDLKVFIHSFIPYYGNWRYFRIF